VALSGGAVKIISCSTASANGFVVASAFVAEQEVVHGSLTAGHKLERFKNEIHLFLRSNISYIKKTKKTVYIKFSVILFLR
jgi:hypothetical protein